MHRTFFLRQTLSFKLLKSSPCEFPIQISTSTPRLFPSHFSVSFPSYHSVSFPCQHSLLFSMPLVRFFSRPLPHPLSTSRLRLFSTRLFSISSSGHFSVSFTAFQLLSYPRTQSIHPFSSIISTSESSSITWSHNLVADSSPSLISHIVCDSPLLISTIVKPLHSLVEIDCSSRLHLLKSRKR